MGYTLEQMDIPPEWVIVLNHSKNHYNKEIIDLKDLEYNEKIINLREIFLATTIYHSYCMLLMLSSFHIKYVQLLE